MGEVADMILRGLICEGCCIIIDGGEPGYPRMCPRCKGEARDHRRRRSPQLHTGAQPEPEAPELVDLDAG